MERAAGALPPLPLEVQGTGAVVGLPSDSNLASLLQAWFERSTGRVFGGRNELSLAMLDRFREAEGLTFDEGE